MGLKKYHLSTETLLNVKKNIIYTFLCVFLVYLYVKPCIIRLCKPFLYFAPSLFTSIYIIHNKLVFYSRAKPHY